MASFKLCISDPSSGKTFQKEIKDNMAKPFIGMNIGETIKGDSIEFSGYEFQITGGSDYCGFPMRKGILGMRKNMTIYGGVGFRGDAKGIKRRKTLCGHKIHDKISQINLKVTKSGSKNLNEIFGVPEAEAKKEEKPQAKEHKAEAHETPKEEHKAKEHKAETHEQSSAPHSVEKKHDAHSKEHKEAKEAHKQSLAPHGADKTE